MFLFHLRNKFPHEKKKKKTCQFSKQYQLVLLLEYINTGTIKLNIKLIELVTPGEHNKHVESKNCTML